MLWTLFHSLKTVFQKTERLFQDEDGYQNHHQNIGDIPSGIFIKKWISTRKEVENFFSKINCLWEDFEEFHRTIFPQSTLIFMKSITLFCEV